MGRNSSTLLVIAGATILTGVFGTGVAGAKASPIGPNERFVGVVNRHTAKATILMACAPPISPFQTGHPLGGQTIAVEPPPTAASKTGYTGTRGRSITATFLLPAASPATSSPIRFTHYGSQTIPTSLTLPCSGSGAVVFSPVPTSKTAQSESVTVSYANITVDPPHSTTSSRTITVTQADSGHSYKLHIGDRVVVHLAGPSFYTWTEPSSSNQAVLQRTEGSSGSKANGTFVAKAKGKSDVTAVDNPNCYPQCLPPSFLFDIYVSVVG